MSTWKRLKAKLAASGHEIEETLDQGVEALSGKVRAIANALKGAQVNDLWRAIRGFSDAFLAKLVKLAVDELADREEKNVHH